MKRELHIFNAILLPICPSSRKEKKGKKIGDVRVAKISKVVINVNCEIETSKRNKSLQRNIPPPARSSLHQ